jgi:uncharacterized protein GlcG (DUF336 family)
MPSEYRSGLVAALVGLALALPAAAQAPNTPASGTPAPNTPAPNTPAPNTPGRGGHTVRGPTLAVALEGAQAAVDACKAGGYLVGVTVVDEEGGVRLSLTADGAPTEGPNGSRRKAVLSALRKASGTELAARAKADAAFAAEVEANKDWLARPGSLLIHSGGKVVGAIAVEGNPHDLDKDVSCAQAGLNRIETRLK